MHYLSDWCLTYFTYYDITGCIRFPKDGILSFFVGE